MYGYPGQPYYVNPPQGRGQPIQPGPYGTPTGTPYPYPMTYQTPPGVQMPTMIPVVRGVPMTAHPYMMQPQMMMANPGMQPAPIPSTIYPATTPAPYYPYPPVPSRAQPTVRPTANPLDALMGSSHRNEPTTPSTSHTTVNTPVKETPVHTTNAPNLLDFDSPPAPVPTPKMITEEDLFGPPVPSTVVSPPVVMPTTSPAVLPPKVTSPPVEEPKKQPQQTRPSNVVEHEEPVVQRVITLEDTEHLGSVNMVDPFARGNSSITVQSKPPQAPVQPPQANQPPQQAQVQAQQLQADAKKEFFSGMNFNNVGKVENKKTAKPQSSTAFNWSDTSKYQDIFSSLAKEKKKVEVKEDDWSQFEGVSTQQQQEQWEFTSASSPVPIQQPTPSIPFSTTPTNFTASTTPPQTMPTTIAFHTPAVMAPTVGFNPSTAIPPPTTSFVSQPSTSLNAPAVTPSQSPSSQLPSSFTFTSSPPTSLEQPKPSVAPSSSAFDKVNVDQPAKSSGPFKPDYNIKLDDIVEDHEEFSDFKSADVKADDDMAEVSLTPPTSKDNTPTTSWSKLEVPTDSPSDPTFVGSMPVLQLSEPAATKFPSLGFDFSSPITIDSTPAFNNPTAPSTKQEPKEKAPKFGLFAFKGEAGKVTDKPIESKDSKAYKRDTPNPFENMNFPAAVQLEPLPPKTIPTQPPVQQIPTLPPKEVQPVPQIPSQPPVQQISPAQQAPQPKEVQSTLVQQRMVYVFLFAERAESKQQVVDEFSNFQSANDDFPFEEPQKPLTTILQELIDQERFDEALQCQNQIKSQKEIAELQPQYDAAKRASKMKEAFEIRNKLERITVTLSSPDAVAKWVAPNARELSLEQMRSKIQQKVSQEKATQFAAQFKRDALMAAAKNDLRAAVTLKNQAKQMMESLLAEATSKPTVVPVKVSEETKRTQIKYAQDWQRGMDCILTELEAAQQLVNKATEDEPLKKRFLQSDKFSLYRSSRSGFY